MREEHQIVRMVYDAKVDSVAADRLIEKYLPFIKAETAKFTKRIPQEGIDDELSIAMFAFYESALAYDKSKGAFLPFASRGIRNRLIDFIRKEQKHRGNISLDSSEDDEERSMLGTLSNGDDAIHAGIDRNAAKTEIELFSAELSAYGLSLSDIADNCPRQERTRKACHRVLDYAKKTPGIFDTLLRTKKVPMTQISNATEVEMKTLERHRKYIVAMLLAFTNGFEVIRGHIRQTTSLKGGEIA